MNDKLLYLIKSQGWVTVTTMIGNDNLYKLLNIHTPIDFLHLFNDLEPVKCKSNRNWILFRYNPCHNFMIYDKKNKSVYINYHEIWSFLELMFGMDYNEKRSLTKEWLGNVYNLKEVTLICSFASSITLVV